MTLLTDAEQIDLLNEEPTTPGPITEKVIAIAKSVTKSTVTQERDSILRELLPYLQQVDTQNQKIAEHDNFIVGLAKSFKGVNQITSFLEKASGKQTSAERK